MVDKKNVRCNAPAHKRHSVFDFVATVTHKVVIVKGAQTFVHVV